MTATTNDTQYRFEKGEHHSVVALLPPLNECPWNDIDRLGTEMLQRLGDRKVSCLMDLSNLSYMGSAMVALVVRVWKHIKEGKGRMVVVNRDAMVLEVLTLAGLHKVWTIVETRERGLQELGVTEGGSFGTVGGASGRPLMIGGGVALLGAVVGLGLLFAGGAVSPKVALAVVFVFSAAGMIVGTLLAMRPVASERNAGLAYLCGGLVALLLGVMNMS